MRALTNLLIEAIGSDLGIGHPSDLLQVVLGAGGDSVEREGFRHTSTHGHAHPLKQLQRQTKW